MTQLVVFAALAAMGCRERANPKDEPPPSKPRAAEVAEAVQQAPTDWDSAIRIDVRYDAARQAVVAALQIAPGFHAYTTGETIGRPLELKIAPESELKAEGEPTYPQGVTKDLPIGRSVIVEGSAEVVAKLASPAAGKKANGTLAYQVCTDEACDRPKTKPWTVTAN
jgi:hypothetical protein